MNRNLITKHGWPERNKPVAQHQSIHQSYMKFPLLNYLSNRNAIKGHVSSKLNVSVRKLDLFLLIQFIKDM